MANVIAATTAAATSSDIVIPAGSSVTFTVIGRFGGGENCIINIKGSDSSYKMVTCEPLPGQVLEGMLNNTVMSRTINAPTSSSITVQLKKTVTGTAVGIDQY